MGWYQRRVRYLRNMEKFNLKWHTFQPHIIGSYKELYETKNFSDIKEIGENKHNEPKNELPSSEESSKEELFDDDFDNTVEARTAIAKTGQSEWSCSLCDKTLTTAEGLKYHIESKHNGKKYPCKQCDNIASSLSSHSRHVKNIH